jgi:hypothetical protein
MEILRTIRDGLFLLGLAVVMVAVPAGSARATFPGKAGPLAYPRVNINESADVGGLTLHGPGLKQKPRPLTTSSGEEKEFSHGSTEEEGFGTDRLLGWGPAVRP